MTKLQEINPRPDGARQGFSVSFPECSELAKISLERFTELKDSVPEAIPRQDLITLARRIYDTRRERTRYFTHSLLGEPVWDMLLALYCLPSRDQRLSVSALCNAADVPPTTALRWLQMLQDRGLIERQQDKNDRRRYLMTMAPKGDIIMSAYLSSISHKLKAP